MAPLRPTILQIIPSLDTGGAELSTVEITSAIVVAGGRALVATQGGRMADRILEAGGEIIPLPMASKNPVQLMSNARALANLIRDYHVDLVHARSRAPAWSALAAARATKRPFITTYHGAYSEKGPLKRAYNSVMARGDIVIANSQYTAALIAARYSTPSDRIRVIHRGVDPALFDRNTISAERLDTVRRSWGTLAEQQIILHAARLTRWKGQEVVITALSLLATQHQELGDWVAVLAGCNQGRTEYAAQLQQQITSLGLDGRIRLVGHVNDMAAAFALASVSLIASTQPEAFGRTAIEAQIAGCPVIATDIGAPRETVLATPCVAPVQRTGWLVPPGDAHVLSQALHDALDLTIAARQSLAARARYHGANHFSLTAMQQATLAVYDEVLKTQLRSAPKALREE